jgi:hypothetical protein
MIDPLFTPSRRDLFRMAPLAFFEAPPGTVPAGPPPANFPDGPAFRRVTLEMSLKPFRRIDDASVRAVCAHIFRQWDALLRRVESVAVMLWTADGSEILEYRGHMEDELEWARYIGIGSPPKNPPGGDPERKSLHAQPRLYMDNPPRIAYGDLRRIVSIIKAVGREVTGKPVAVGATFDPGPEFANSKFKYSKHPEISPGGTMGAATWVTCTARLNADPAAYAGFPYGIQQGTSVGTFLGRQSARFLRDLGFDYLWLSNGFGFSASAWNVTGPLFDGKRFDATRAASLRDELLGFWRDFRKECPDIPLETRGTNLLPGSDLASAATPLRDIYRGGFNMVAPPNSPWAALDGDFGLELAGYLARISELPPGDLFPFRYYTHDPWWLNSPWFDRYNREPHDIYLPLALARLDARGNVTRPGYLEFLTIDDSYGRTPDQCPNEVTPHILDAMDHFSDEPGLVTWVYPFDEYHDLVFGKSPDPALPFFGDWFVRSAINDGFPLNTVVSTGNFLSSLRAQPQLYRHTVLLSPVPAAGSAVEKALLDEWHAGADVLLYGPVRQASPQLRAALGLELGAPVEGVLPFTSNLPADRFRQGAAACAIHHRSLTSAGPVDTVAAAGAREVEVCIQVGKAGERRAYAVFRPANHGTGRLGWLRGTLAASVTNAKLPVSDDPAKLFSASAWLRALLSRFGVGLAFHRTSPAGRCPLILGARSNNGYFLAGYSPSISTAIEMSFPWGAPLLSGSEAWVESGCSQYTMPRAWHREIRCFVRQDEAGEIACAEAHSGHPGIRRRLVLRGLKQATVTFLPERGTRPILALNDLRPQNEKSLPYETHDGGRRISAGPLTGTLQISW